jgi:hypothetical protein
MMDDQTLTAEYWRLFGRVLGRAVQPGLYRPADLPEWDSLRHVELVFELEETFRIEVPPDMIATLYTDTDAVLDFLRQAGVR